MKAPRFTAQTVINHMEQNWHCFASCFAGDKRCKFFYNGVGVYRVNVDCSTVYQGNDLNQAIATWEENT